MPYFAGPVGDERDALLTFLEVPRAALRAAVFGLTDEQETLDDVLAYYAETAALTAQIVSGIGDLGQPSAVNPEQSARARRHHPRGARRQARRPIAGCLRSRIDGNDQARNLR